MAVQKCKGTRDLSPKEMARFRCIEGVFRDSCLKWGYEEVRTPTLEYLYLFTSAGTLTPGRLGKVYSFLDWDGWSGERVVLRPDGTIPIARYYVESIPDQEVAKLFYVTNIFRFEDTGQETREFWQCGAELVGPSSTAADVEMVVIALDTLKRLGIEDVQLRLSHAGLIRALLTKFGLTPEEQHKLFDRVLDGDAQALTGATPELARAVAPLLGLKGRSSGFLKNAAALLSREVPELEAPFANFTEFAATLDSLGIPYEIDINSGRGFEYYTGIIFHVMAHGKAVAGGGRYDALIPLLGGRDTPASGFALGLDTLMDLIADRAPAEEPAAKVLVQTRESAAALKEAFGLAEALHEAGYIAEVQIGAGQTIGSRWLLEITEPGQRFILRDNANRRHFESATVDEVLSLLKAHSA